MAELKLHQDLEHFSLLGAKKAREKDKASKKVTVGGFGGIDPDVLKSTQLKLRSQRPSNSTSRGATVRLQRHLQRRV